MQWINRALEQATRKTAPANGYRRKEEFLSFLTMPHLRVVSVEKNPNYLEFSLTNTAKFMPAVTTYGHRFLMKSEHVIVIKFDI